MLSRGGEPKTARGPTKTGELFPVNEKEENFLKNFDKLYYSLLLLLLFKQKFKPERLREDGPVGETGHVVTGGGVSQELPDADLLRLPGGVPKTNCTAGGDKEPIDTPWHPNIEF